jgi:hypothetical protein
MGRARQRDRRFRPDFSLQFSVPRVIHPALTRISCPADAILLKKVKIQQKFAFSARNSVGAAKGAWRAVG